MFNQFTIRVSLISVLSFSFVLGPLYAALKSSPGPTPPPAVIAPPLRLSNCTEFNINPIKSDVLANEDEVQDCHRLDALRTSNQGNLNDVNAVAEVIQKLFNDYLSRDGGFAYDASRAAELQCRARNAFPVPTNLGSDPNMLTYLARRGLCQVASTTPVKKYYHNYAITCMSCSLVP